MKYKISIIIATYNADKYIQRAITSVLNQCLENYECIVVDGMSTDKTLSIIAVSYTHLTLPTKLEV